MNVQGGEAVVGAFGTPTIAHFCAVLVIAAILSAPWSALWAVALALGVCGGAGLAYALIALMRTRRQIMTVTLPGIINAYVAASGKHGPAANRFPHELTLLPFYKEG